MNDIVKQISSYNLFNYLLPGAVFCLLAQEATQVPLVQGELFSGFFFYYFVGLTISRVGSLFVEPMLKRSKLIQYLPHTDFIRAETKDSKIGLLSEVNNVYRTMISLGLCVLAYPSVIWFADKFEIGHAVRYQILGAFLIGLFFMSFRKQTRFVKQRVETVIRNQPSS